MKLTALFGIILLIFFSSCGKRNTGFSLRHGGEPNCGWINLGTLRPDDNETTNNVSFIDSAAQYSLGYRQRLNQLSDKQVKEIKFEADVKPLTDNAEFTMVISLDSQGNGIMWEGIKHDTKEFPKGKWSTVKHSAKIPVDKIDGNTEATIYVWNNNGSSLIDNIRIEGN